MYGKYFTRPRTEEFMNARIKPYLLLAAMLFCGFSTISAYAAGGETGGGANSINGKLIDEYFHPISTESAYKSVQSILAVLHAKLQPTDNSSDVPMGSPDWWRSELQATFDKTPRQLSWYFIPGKVKNLTEPITGIPFPSDQVAVQTATGDVWVDEDLFRSKNLKPDDLKALQISTILHEIVLRTAHQQDLYLSYQLKH